MSSAVRIFRGCRALLAQAKPATPKSAAAAAAAAAVPKPKPKAKATSAAAKTAAVKTAAKPKAKKSISPEAKAAIATRLNKSMPLSPLFRSFYGAPEATRQNALKKVWEHIKANNLQNPANKREIVCDGKLKTIFAGKERVGMMEISKLLSGHFVKA